MRRSPRPRTHWPGSPRSTSAARPQARARFSAAWRSTSAYGNIGAADRLDFTVIGPAVNLVTRLEHLCADLEQPIVVSGSVTRASRRQFRSLGRHKLKGIAEPQEAFTLA